MNNTPSPPSESTGSLLPTPRPPEPDDYLANNWVYRELIDYCCQTLDITPDQAHDSVIDFMRAFCSVTLMIPDPATIETIAKKRQVIRSLARDASQKSVQRLEDHTNLPKRAISKLFARATGQRLADARNRNGCMRIHPMRNHYRRAA